MAENQFHIPNQTEYLTHDISKLPKANIGLEREPYLASLPSKESNHSEFSKCLESDDIYNMKGALYSTHPVQLSDQSFQDYNCSTDISHEEHSNGIYLPGRSHTEWYGSEQALDTENSDNSQGGTGNEENNKISSVNAKRKLHAYLNDVDAINELSHEFENSQPKKVHTETLDREISTDRINSIPKEEISEDKSTIMIAAEDDTLSAPSSGKDKITADVLENVDAKSVEAGEPIKKVPGKRGRKKKVVVELPPLLPLVRSESKVPEITNEPYPDILSMEEYKEKVPLGNNHQTKLPSFDLNAQNTSRKKRVFKTKWNPEKIATDELDKFKEEFASKHSINLLDQEFSEILAKQEYNPAKALKWCTKNNSDFQVYIKKSSSRRRLLMKGVIKN